MEAIASYAVVAFLLTGLVQYLKKRMPVHALLILAGLSFIFAGVYAVLVHFNSWEFFVAQATILISVANLIFNVFKAFYEGMGGDDSTVHVDA